MIVDIPEYVMGKRSTGKHSMDPLSMDSRS